MDNKERWNTVKESMYTDPLVLSWKMSSTVRGSLIGLEFILARYKFAARMMQNRNKLKVLDLGCNDGLGDLMLSQCCDCDEIVGVDFDEEAIKWAKDNVENKKIRFLNKDFMGLDVFRKMGGCDCVLSLDVIEHIPQKDENKYLETVYKNLHEDGVAIIGTPSVNMYSYASPWNKTAHINNYSQERLYNLLNTKFRNVFIFGMNDEVLHTGFYPMTCYIMALACGKR